MFSGEGKERTALLVSLEILSLAYSEGPNRVDVSFPSLQDGISSSFLNVIF
jgi:hypothetical protein